MEYCEESYAEARGRFERQRLHQRDGDGGQRRECENTRH